MSNLNTTMGELVPLLQRLQSLRTGYDSATNAEKSKMEQEFEETKVKVLAAQQRLQTIMESMTLDTNVMSFFEASYPNYKKGIQNLGLLTVEENMGQAASNNRNNNNPTPPSPKNTIENNQDPTVTNNSNSNGAAARRNNAMNSNGAAARRNNATNSNGAAARRNNSMNNTSMNIVATNKNTSLATPPNTGGPNTGNMNKLPRTTGGRRKTQRRRTNRRK